MGDNAVEEVKESKGESGVDLKAAAEARRKRILEKGAKRLSMAKGDIRTLDDESVSVSVEGESPSTEVQSPSTGSGRRRRNRGNRGDGAGAGALSPVAVDLEPELKEAAKRAAKGAAVPSPSTSYDERLRRIEEEVQVNTAASDADIVKNGLKGGGGGVDNKGKGKGTGTGTGTTKGKGTGTTKGKEEVLFKVSKGKVRDYASACRLMSIALVAIWAPFSSVSLGIFLTQFVSGLVLSWWNRRNGIGAAKGEESKGWLGWIMWFFEKGIFQIVMDYMLRTTSEMSLYILIRSLRADIPPLDHVYVGEAAEMMHDGTGNQVEELVGDLGSLGEL